MTGPAHGAQTNPVATPSSTDLPCGGVVVGARSSPISQPRSDRHQRRHHAVSQSGKQHRQSEQRHHGKGDGPAMAVHFHRPAPGHRCQRRHRRKGEDETRQQRQAAARKRPVGARQHERQDRKDAGRCNREQAGQIGKDKERHRLHQVELEACLSGSVLPADWMCQSAGRGKLAPINGPPPDRVGRPDKHRRADWCARPAPG